MNDPKRLLAGWNDELGRAALGSAALDGPPPGAKERAAVAVIAVMAATTATTAAVAATTVTATTATTALTTATTATTSAPAAAAGALGLMKTIGIMSLVGVGAIGGAMYVSASPPPPAPVVVPAPSVARSAASIASPHASPHAPSIITAPAPSASSAPSVDPPLADPPAKAPPSPSASASTLVSELAAIDDARRALANGQPARALALLDAYSSTFPRGSLGAEATVLRIEALLAAGDRGSAVTLGRRFLAASPESAYAPRVRSLIGEIAP